jgi:trimeric autotransporter adhesin
MKNLFLLIALVYSSMHSFAQNVGIGTNKPLSKLHVAGDLRVDSLGKRGSGVVIHNISGVLTSLKFTGSKADVLRGDGTFQSLNAVAADAAPYWSTSGNSGTNPDSNFIGTTDDAPLLFRVNNQKAGEIDQRNNNTSLGLLAGWAFDSTSYGNTAIGAYALQINTKGTANTAIGYGSLANDSIGSSNTAVGNGSLGSNETGNRNCAFGGGAMNGYTTGDENCAIGWLSMWGFIRDPNRATGYQNTALGSRSMEKNENGTRNTAVGAEALNSFRFGGHNTAIGASALFSNLIGQYNTAVGTESLFKNIADNQTAIGYRALYSNYSGKNNTSVGYQALFSNDGNWNTSTGFRSLYLNLLGTGNVANGAEALYSNTSGSSNVAIGFRSLLANTTGVSNTATGTRALVSNTTGLNNTASGYGALLNNVTGFQNTALGMFADVTTVNLQNATAIGYGAKVNASNKVRIGNAAVTKIEGQVPFSTPSDGRFKFNVKEDVIGLEFIMKLRPVTYQFDVSRFDEIKNTHNIIQTTYNEAAGIRRTGFIAQEVEKAARQSHYNFSGINKPESESDHYSLSYEAFVVPLVKGMQEQQVIIEKMQKELAAQQEINIKLLNELNTLQKEVNTIKSHQK